MRRNSVLAKVLPALAVAGVIGASVLASPLTALGGIFTGYGGVGYGYTFGGQIKGGPSVSGPTGATGAEDLAVRGGDNAMWTGTANANAFSSWTSRGGILVTSPAQTQMSATLTNAYVEGADAAVWYKARTSGTWAATWTKIGGVITAAPGAASGFGGTRTDLFVRGSDSAIWWSNTTNGTTYSAFAKVGGTVLDAAAVNAQASRLDLYVLGTDGAVWWAASTNGTSFGAFSSLGGRTNFAAASDSCSGAHQDVWVVGTDGALWGNHTVDNGAHWAGWTSWGGKFTGSLTAICRTPGTNGTTVDVFGRGGDGAVWRFAVTGV